MAPHAEDEAIRRAATIKNLCEVLDQRVPASVSSHAVLKQGDAAEQIVRTAREEGADIILLTTHGAHGWQPGVLGTVAEAVVRTASCPVLTISGPSATLTGAKVLKYGALAESGGALRPELEMVSSDHIYLDGD
jgi:nucleotide-binding universal stress UspA family protein